MLLAPSFLKTMQYLTIEELKKQMNIDPDFNDDNEYLEMVGSAAEDMTAAMLDCPLTLIEAENGEIPATIRHAMRMIADYFYAKFRGSSDADMEIPIAYTTMLKLYRKYN
jgi:hypothetical protein